MLAQYLMSPINIPCRECPEYISTASYQNLLHLDLYSASALLSSSTRPNHFIVYLFYFSHQLVQENLSYFVKQGALEKHSVPLKYQKPQNHLMDQPIVVQASQGVLQTCQSFPSLLPLSGICQHCAVYVLTEMPTSSLSLSLSLSLSSVYGSSDT